MSKTVPHHSYRNPAKRIMSVINLGPQLIRQLDDELEEQVRKCGSVSEVRELASKSLK